MIQKELEVKAMAWFAKVFGLIRVVVITPTLAIIRTVVAILYKLGQIFFGGIRKVWGVGRLGVTWSWRQLLRATKWSWRQLLRGAKWVWQQIRRQVALAWAKLAARRGVLRGLIILTTVFVVLAVIGNMMFSGLTNWYSNWSFTLPAWWKWALGGVLALALLSLFVWLWKTGRIGGEIAGTARSFPIGKFLKWAAAIGIVVLLYYQIPHWLDDGIVITHEWSEKVRVTRPLRWIERQNVAYEVLTESGTIWPIERDPEGVVLQYCDRFTFIPESSRTVQFRLMSKEDVKEAVFDLWFQSDYDNLCEKAAALSPDQATAPPVEFLPRPPHSRVGE